MGDHLMEEQQGRTTTRGTDILPLKLSIAHQLGDSSFTYLPIGFSISIICMTQDVT